MGGIDNEILQQLRIQFFGFGLALGDEFRKLREFVGGDDRAMELYQSFRDPHSAPRPDLRVFSFMAVGPVSPLAFSGKPIFFSVLSIPRNSLQRTICLAVVGLDESQIENQDTLPLTTHLVKDRDLPQLLGHQLSSVTPIDS